ncbi:GTPase ObgE [Candidatus Phytoplasma pruni]|uniref:GTPase Obg n=1 Tax=Candidatus Phytoplasma pruni TaxID=479893 RepID=A0A0M1N0R3_9MOLU|nr:GTPase ObgE [Candidatus Phytoplasma pruni]KOR75625.1 GTPase ObgE [Candidatus Phytoplasma pruni]
MNFIDEAINFVQAGNGGNGIVSFRREKFVPYGGPSGGNGGQGGSVIFVGESGENTLLKLRYKTKIKALHGVNGKNKTQNGAKAEDLFVKVPLGTLVYNNKDNSFIGEILEHGQQLVIAKGGRGGRGNFALANSKNKVPNFAEKGDLGESLTIKTELKVLADVGLIGYPNVGKSSLISVISNAKPKVDSYPFTTLQPFLGMVYYQDFSFTVADIPGLIENSHLGRGMGISFLKHIERCKVLVHLLSPESDDIYQNYQNLLQELKMYNPAILKKPQIIVVNKMDLPDSEAKLADFQKKISEENILSISTWNSFNLDALKFKIIDSLKNHQPIMPEIDTTHQFFTLDEEKQFEVYKDEFGDFVVKGKMVEKFFYRTDFNNYESVKKFSHILKKIGVEEELKRKGMKDNNQVKICDYIFEIAT